MEHNRFIGIGDILMSEETPKKPAIKKKKTSWPFPRASLKFVPIKPIESEVIDIIKFANAKETVHDILKRIISAKAFDIWTPQNSNPIYDEKGNCLNESEISEGPTALITLTMGDYLKLVAAMEREEIF